MSVDYEVLHDAPEVAKIFSGQKQVAELRNVAKGLYELTANSKSWQFSRRFDGSMLPFSMLVTQGSTEILKVKDHLFPYGVNFYMFGGIPESQNPKDHLQGYKYIIRLTNFPHTRHEQIDEETRSRLKRHRGVTVGRIHGLGSKGFHVMIEDELKDVGLQLTATTYLLYSTA